MERQRPRAYDCSLLAEAATDSPSAALPELDYRAVGAHASHKSGFIAYNGLVYDVTDFLRLHPGGRSLLLSVLGTDVTDTIDNLHDMPVGRLLTQREYRARYGIRVVARLSPAGCTRGSRIGARAYQSRRRYLRPDPMAIELRHEVFSYLRATGVPSRKPLANCILLLLMFYIMYIACIYFAFIQGSAVACILLGPVATFMAVNVGHTVMHGGFAGSPIIARLGRLRWDLGGYSSNCWDIEHQNHHQAPHTSIDVQTSGGSIVRFFEHQEYKWFHRYQIFYIWVGLGLYSLRAWISHTFKTLTVYKCVPFDEKITHIIAKVIGFIGPIALSFYLFEVVAAAIIPLT